MIETNPSESKQHKRGSTQQVPWIIRRGALLVMGLFGWKLIGDLSGIDKAVIIGVFHTSNWDGPVALLTALSLGVRFRWLGKKELFRFPLGLLLRALGGIPIDRSKSKNVVEQIVQMFAANNKLFIITWPEGKRKKASHWKTGFYHMALQANVPLALGFLDYGKKESGIGELMTLSGDMEADMKKFRAFYENVTPRVPENASEVRFAPKNS